MVMSAMPPAAVAEAVEALISNYDFAIEDAQLQLYEAPEQVTLGHSIGALVVAHDSGDWA
jgi:hypothetical protein